LSKERVGGGQGHRTQHHVGYSHRKLWDYETKVHIKSGVGPNTRKKDTVSTQDWDLGFVGRLRNCEASRQSHPEGGEGFKKETKGSPNFKKIESPWCSKGRVLRGKKAENGV